MTALEMAKTSEKGSDAFGSTTTTVRLHEKASNGEDHDAEIHPPSYQSLFAQDEQAPVPPSLQTSSARTTSTPTSLPFVIPQTSKALRGAFFSPFIRAYPPSLSTHGIAQEDFLAFVDGLNEVFISHPIFQGASFAGGIMSMCYGVHPVQFAGLGLQVASGVAGAATSYVRTKAYFKTCNETLFHPAGLHATVATTKKMMARVGHPDPEGRLRLQPIASSDTTSTVRVGSESGTSEETTFEDPSKANDFKARRMQALEGYVAPLNLEVPGPVAPENVLCKMSAWQANRLEKKQTGKYEKRRAELEEERGKMDRKLARKERKQNRAGGRFERETAKLEQEFLEDIAKENAKQAEEEEKLERRLSKASIKDGEKLRREVEKEAAKVAREAGKEKEKLTKEYQRELQKMQKKSIKKTGKRDEDFDKDSKKIQKEEGKIDRREERHANKIRWVVITPWDPSQDDGEIVSESDSSRSESDKSS